MPGGDGTGPMGLGSRTGRATGFCAGYHRPGFANPFPGRRFGSYYNPGNYYSKAYQDEKEFLKEQAERLKEKIARLDSRLNKISETESKE